MSEKRLAFGSKKTFAEAGQGDLKARIGNAVRYYMCGNFARGRQEADRRTQLELERGFARETLDVLAGCGVTVEGKHVLEIGAGMGATTTEIARRGAAAVMGIEPDGARRLLARDRVSEVPGSPPHIVGALGEQSPFPGASFDVVVATIRRLQEARATLADRAKLHLALGALYLRQQDQPRAEHAFQEAGAREPKSVEAHFFLGSFCVAKRDVPQAEREFKAAADLAPSTPELPVDTRLHA